MMSLNSRLGASEKQAMVNLLEKMGNCIESMEGDIGQMNDFLKAISLTQIDQTLDEEIIDDELEFKDSKTEVNSEKDPGDGF